MEEKINFKVFLAYTFVFITSLVLISCGKPISAAKTESTGGGNGNGGGTYPTPTPPMGFNMVSCSLTAGPATYTSAPLTLTVSGNVDRVSMDNNPVAAPDPVTHTSIINYPIVLSGTKTVNAVVQNSAAGTSNTCSTTFVAPDLVADRTAVEPKDASTYRTLYNQFLTDSKSVTTRYVVAVNKSTGQGYYNSISLDPKAKSGLLDAWNGWQLIPGQTGARTDLPILVAKYTDNSFTISAFNTYDGIWYATLATCPGTGVCTFSSWNAY